MRRLELHGGWIAPAKRFFFRCVATENVFIGGQILGMPCCGILPETGDEKVFKQVRKILRELREKEVSA